MCDEKRGVVVGMVVSVYKSDASGKLRDTAFAIPSETLWQICPEIRPSELSPYLELEAFTDGTAQFFFGREMLTEKLLNVLRGGNRFLAVFGPSGSGKSSVVQAGLLPALKKGMLAGSQKWAQFTMRPADNPFEQMKAAGLDSINVNGFLKSHVHVERVILFIDQFEELFTLCPDDIGNRFVRDLATELENSRLILILSMRDDFYSAFQAQAIPLAESEHLNIENVPGALKRDELVAMIERPAETVGLALEDGLTELIIKDLTRDSEARSSTLPLLEFALTQLWEKRRDGQLTHEAYQVIGSVTGSLARWADDAYSDLPKEDQMLAESLLTSLVHLGDEAQGLPDTRRRRTLTELDISDSSQRVIKHFTDRRLVITSGKMVELVHDALVREWDKLSGWIKDDRDNLKLIEGVSEAAWQWKASGRDESLLNHRGTRLNWALTISKLPRYRPNLLEQEYLAACEEEQDQMIRVSESQQALLRAEKMKSAGRLTASIAHEVNNPLQSLQNYLHLAGREDLPAEKRRGYLELARNELERLMKTMQRMLDFYRPGAVKIEAVDVLDLLKHALSLTSQQLRQRHIRVTTDLPDSLPAIYAVSSQIQQIFFNLILNSFDAMPSGGDLKIGARKLNYGVEMTFQDNGPGIPEDRRNNIFEPFFSTKDGGTGLGLTVSYNIATIHGGTLKLLDRQGSGACFQLFLPLGSKK